MILDTIADRLKSVQTAIKTKALEIGRDPAGITLVGVTKMKSPDLIQTAIDAGLRDIGENYLQDFEAKIPDLNLTRVRCHLIGHLQTNKVKKALALFDTIHSVDRFKLADALQKEAQKLDKTIPILVQVNTSGEESKYGLAPEDTVAFVKQIAPLPHLKIEGLMTIAAFLDDPEAVRPMFRRLRELRDEIDSLKLPRVWMKELSMGMTNDYLVAIEEGATMVRVGTAIFGARA